MNRRLNLSTKPRITSNESKEKRSLIADKGSIKETDGGDPCPVCMQSLSALETPLSRQIHINQCLDTFHDPSISSSSSLLQTASKSTISNENQPFPAVQLCPVCAKSWQQLELTNVRSEQLVHLKNCADLHQVSPALLREALPGIMDDGTLLLSVEHDYKENRTANSKNSAALNGCDKSHQLQSEFPEMNYRAIIVDDDDDDVDNDFQKHASTFKTFSKPQKVAYKTNETDLKLAMSISQFDGSFVGQKTGRIINTEHKKRKDLKPTIVDVDTARKRILGRAESILYGLDDVEELNSTPPFSNDSDIKAVNSKPLKKTSQRSFWKIANESSDLIRDFSIQNIDRLEEYVQEDTSAECDLRDSDKELIMNRFHETCLKIEHEANSFKTWIDGFRLARRNEIAPASLNAPLDTFAEQDIRATSEQEITAIAEQEITTFAEQEITTIAEQEVRTSPVSRAMAAVTLDSPLKNPKLARRLKPEKSKPTKECISAKEFINFFRSHQEWYRQVLLYDPVDVDQLKQAMEEHDTRWSIGRNQLIMLLNEHGILFNDDRTQRHRSAPVSKK